MAENNDENVLLEQHEDAMPEIVVEEAEDFDLLQYITDETIPINAIDAVETNNNQVEVMEVNP